MSIVDAGLRTSFVSTSFADPADRFDVWRGMIRDRLVDTRVEPLTRGAFHGVAKAFDVDAVGLTHVSTSAHRIDRVPDGSYGDDPVFFTYQVRGAYRLRQDGREIEVRRGDLVLADTARPYVISVPEESASITLHLPRRMMPLVSATSPLITARHIGVTGSWSRTLGSLLRTLRAEGERDAASAAAFFPHVLGLLETVAVGVSGVDGHENGAVVRERALAVMRERLSETALDVDVIAEVCGISRRTLYRVFDGERAGVATVLRNMRVRRARELLRAAPALTQAEVAVACGFGSVSTLRRALGA